MEADFLVFYRIRDWDDEIDAPTFFRLAYRVAAYGGVMASRALAEEQKDTTMTDVSRGKQYEEVIDGGDTEAIQSHPLLSDMVDWKQAGG